VTSALTPIVDGTAVPISLTMQLPACRVAIRILHSQIGRERLQGDVPIDLANGCQTPPCGKQNGGSMLPRRVRRMEANLIT
jgi:hypothetical protein